jgi:hypothetical protein
VRPGPLADLGEAMSVTHKIISGESAFTGPILLSREQASEYLTIPVPTLDDYRNREIGPPWCKIEGQIRYLLSDLDAYIAACRRVPTRLK